LSFFQVNTIQAEILYEKVKEFACVNKNETVFDLFCGTGTIGLYLASQSKNIIGIESVAQAVADAKINAEVNGIYNAAFVCGEAEKEIARLYSEGVYADVIVIDPPRKGCEISLLNTIIKMKPDRVVYVSCNPSTLARDLAILCKEGDYGIESVQPVDMFPYSSHVECVVLMSRVEG
jgi:23S rRNA (uracil1939-C5)-methyltransferase